jgi:inorganic pyrophosphatase
MKSVNATHYELIPTFPSKRDHRNGSVHAIVETPQGSPYKYALDVQHGIIALKASMPEGYRWPFDYGFVPQTLADDGDPLDILMLLSEGTFSGCMVKARILGAIRLSKNGVENDRVIGAPERMPGRRLFTDDFATLSDLPDDLRREIESFLCGYSEGEGNEIELQGAVEAAEALDLLEKARKAFRKHGF